MRFLLTADRIGQFPPIADEGSAAGWTSGQLARVVNL
jgi:hypothetical protein